MLTGLPFVYLGQIETITVLNIRLGTGMEGSKNPGGNTSSRNSKMTAVLFAGLHGALF